MASFLLVSIMLSLLLVLFSHLLQLIAAARRHLPPGPCPLPLIGNLLDIGDLPHRSFARLAERYGPLMTVRLGAATCVVASSPATARAVLQTHNASLAGRGRQDAWHAGGHAENSVFVLPPGRKWRLLRKLGAAHLFSRRKLAELAPLRDEIVGGLLRRVAERADHRGGGGGGAPVDVGRLALAANVELLWRSVFSTRLDAATLDVLCDVAREAAVLLGTPNISDFFPAVAALDLQGLRRRLAELMKNTYRLVDAQIDHRMRCRELRGGRGGEAMDLLDVLLDMSEQEREDGDDDVINRDLMRALLTDLFVGGSDSTATTVEWAMAELLQNPEIMKTLQQEIKMVLGTRSQVEESDIGQLPYLQAIVKETLRLHPIVPLRLYEAERTVEIEGHTIPIGSKVIVNAWAIHQSAKVWIQPEKFLPERFITKDIDFTGRHFEFIPFGSGRHICIGLPLANRMLHMILGSLMLQFKWTMPQMVNRNGLDMAEKFGLVVSMATRPNIIASKM
ncbi:geraniol 8-hydroxylase-like [Oryza glaberrima]|uniref:geraniol 8-hydroxylase-like n=1 Tax=Oryza glaberrima TaxID=4538 RepID=UPI00224C5E6E|nr:geraniol 8-hydroxylase-like [Oryza glaberrima]